jgi:hypothetical protein
VEFQWKRAHRDMHRSGEYPHISIEDLVYVETVGGDLTIKVEDNTASGQGIYSEPVEDADQTLDDAEILYAIIGPLVVLRILPYRETVHRYLVFNGKTREVHRLDGIGQSCVLLPEDQGILFANGYMLATGEVKTYETGHSGLRFERRIASGNGEDTLFVFYQRASGHYVLFSYNVIAQTVVTPVVCNGFALDPNGGMILFQAPDQPQKHHALQVWRTPYVLDSSTSVPAEKRESLLFKIGNSTSSAAMAEAREILILLGKGDTYADVYLELVRRSREVLDGISGCGRPRHSISPTRLRRSTPRPTRQLPSSTRSSACAWPPRPAPRKSGRQPSGCSPRSVPVRRRTSAASCTTWLSCGCAAARSSVCATCDMRTLR